MTVGDQVVAALEAAGVTAAFGVVSIHNMPILDAINRRGRIRFVPARGEAGALNMADAHARVSGRLGVAVTSTGTAAGNAAGAMVEALAAGTPLLHLTGQIDSPYLDRDLGVLHEARNQLGMLQAVSKAACRIASPQDLHLLGEAIRAALTAPTGPVSVEIPIDVQLATTAEKVPGTFFSDPKKVPDTFFELADRLKKAKRPLLWVGGGARHAGDAVKRLAELGFGVVSSVQGRGVLPEDHPMSLGAFNTASPVEALYETCDAMVVAGSRLRSNETLGYRLRLPKPLYRIDVRRVEHPYKEDLFIEADAAQALSALADALPSYEFGDDIRKARMAAEAEVRSALGPYEALVDALQASLGRDFVWVRDVTISNSTWGNRLLRIHGPRDGVHALGGGIGQGVPMAIGAALAAGGRKTVCLLGDGGLQLSLGELATAMQEKADILFVLMNDRGYGVIRNIWDSAYGGRRAYSDLHTPDFALLAKSLNLAYLSVKDRNAFAAAVPEALAQRGPVLLEVDMTSIGPFSQAFAGPPVRKEAVK
ncbi:MAG: thiamine pyrophosphate-binding protein [Betaproteobacteria bacterium]